MPQHFKIIVSMYNVEPWVQKTAQSVLIQEYPHFQCIFVDDISSDNTLPLLKEKISGDSRFKIVTNEEKKYSLENIYNGIKFLEPKDEDIILTLDGDDWLAHKNVLDILKRVYEEKKCWMTYGNYLEFPSGQKGVEVSPYPKEVIKTNSFRKNRWRASHLRTFKFKLWKKIKHKDFLDWEGNFFKTSIDKAFMYPMLEMAGDRSEYIDEVLYIYNFANPLNIHKVRRKLQLLTSKYLREKSPYSRLKKL